jgi:hypothetical protein
LSSGSAKKAIDDYVTTLELFGNKVNISSDIHLAIARNYEKLGQFCDAESYVETWVAFNPARNDSSRMQAIIADYTAKGRCAPAGGRSEMPNLDVVKLILQRVNKPDSLISFVTDRLGHDRRYAIDSSFAERELKWKPRHKFEQGLVETIDWYLHNESWWQPLLERAGRY